MAIVGQLLVLVGVNNAGLTAGLASSQAQLRGFAGAGTAAINALKTAAIVGGVAIGGGIAFGVKSAADFQDAFAGVKKTVDEADLAAAGLTFDDLARQFRTMATEIPVAATELAAIGETAGALGIRASDIDDFTKTVALLGVTTNLSTDEAATALGKVGTILGLTGPGFENFADILVNLGNKGASTEAEIIEVTKRFAAAGLAVGLSTPQILAFSSAIASAGVEPEAAGSSLSRLFGNIVKETANASSKGKAFASVTGKSFKDFSALVKTDTVGAMLLFLGSLNKLDKFGQARALQAVGITAVRDQNAIRLLAQTYEKNLVPALKNAEDSAGALSTEATKRFDTFNSKLSLLGNNFNELLITIGTPLLPPLTDFVQSVTAGIQSVAGSIDRWVASGQALTSQFAPVISGIVARFLELVPIALAVGETILDLATRVWEGGLNKAVQTGATVIGSVIDVLKGLAETILKNQDVMNILRTVADAIGTGFGIAATGVQNLLTFLGQLGDTIRGNAELMRSLAGIGDAISDAFKAAGPQIQEVIAALKDVITFAGEAADWIAKVVGGTPTEAGRGGAPGRGGGPNLPKATPFLNTLPWPLGPVNTPPLDIGPFKNVLGGDSAGTGSLLGQRGPITLNHTTVLNVDGQKFGEVTDRTLYNNASQSSSGFTHGALP